MLDRFLLYSLVVITLGLGTYCLLTPKSGKHGYIINQKVFEGFKGKIELEKKLKLQLKAHSQSLDSLQKLMDSDFNTDLLKKYQDLKNKFVSEEQQLSEQFTADIWKEINRYVEQYGKDKGYDFIYGATGNGSLMYGNKSVDLTNEMIIYINNALDK
jgi:outer membrane protein